MESANKIKVQFQAHITISLLFFRWSSKNCVLPT